MELTKQQRAFLASYLDDISGDRDDGENREAFIERVAQMDFDDGLASKPAVHRIARNLQRKGVFAELDIHDGGHVYAVFSKAGAGALYDIRKERR